MKARLTQLFLYISLVLTSMHLVAATHYERIDYDKQLLAQAKKQVAVATDPKKKTEPSVNQSKETDSNYIEKMKTRVDQESKKSAELKIFDVIGKKFLPQVKIPKEVFSIFNAGLKLKDIKLVNKPKAKKSYVGFGITGTTLIKNAPVQVTIYLVQIAKKVGFSLAIELPTNYKISDIFPTFKKLDDFDLPKVQLIASTFDYTDKDGRGIKDGFNIVADLDLTGPLRALGELRKKAKEFDSIVFDVETPMYLHGVISSLRLATFKADIPLRLGIDFTKIKNFPREFSSIIKKITTDNIILSISFLLMEQKLKVQSGIQITLGHQTQPLRFQAFGGIDVTSGKINFGGKMPDMLELDVIAIGDVLFELYIDPAVESVLIFFGVPFSGLALGGRIDLGKKGTERVSLGVKGKISLEAKKITDFLLEVNGENIQFESILNLLTQMATKSGKSIKIPASKIPVLNIKKLYGKIVPWDTEIANETVKAGFQLVLDAELFGKKLKLDVDVQHKSLIFKGAGSLSNIIFEIGNKPIFKLTGPGLDKKYNTPDDGPMVSCNFEAAKIHKASFKIASLLEVPPLGLKNKIDLEASASGFYGTVDTQFLGFSSIFDINIDPKKWKEMSIKYTFKNDFQNFLSKQARTALESLKKEATADLAKADRKIGELAGELNKLKRDQTRIKQRGVSAAQREINKTRATIRRINSKIRRLKKECKDAPFYRKPDVCIRVGVELTAQGTALAAQETYLNALLKPGKQVIKGTMEALNTINQSMQTVSTEISKAKILQKGAQGVLTAVSKAITGIVKGLEIFKVSEVVGEINAKDLSEGKLPKVSLKAEVTIPQLSKVSMHLKEVQFDFKNPIKSAGEIAKKLVSGIKIG